MSGIISVHFVDQLPPGVMPHHPPRPFNKDEVIQAALSRPSTPSIVSCTENMPSWQVRRLTAVSWFAFNESTTHDDSAGSITENEIQAVMRTYDQAMSSNFSQTRKFPTRVWSHATKEQRNRIFHELLSRDSGLCMIKYKSNIDAEWKDHYPKSEFAQLVRELLETNKSTVRSEYIYHESFFLWDAADFRRRSNLLQLSEEFRTQQPRIFEKLKNLKPNQIQFSDSKYTDFIQPELNRYVQYTILLGREFPKMNEYLVKTGLMDCPFALELFTDNLVAKYLQHVRNEIKNDKQASQIPSFSDFCSAQMDP